jgi:transglutaminase-like putative cysteine protease
MPTDANFRFSSYLALALACVAVGYAEYPLLPEVIAFAALAVVGLGVLYFLESRVAFLSIPAANRLGVAVGLVFVMWAAYRVKREVDTAEFINMGWHMLIVAMCGPLVMLVVVAKVARGDKHAGDYWTLHGVALAGVGLACAFAEEPVCFALVGLYLVAAVWSLTLLHLGRATGAIPPIPGGRQPATKTVAVAADPTGHRTDLTPAVMWALVAVLGALPLYLLTPRSAAGKADFGKPRIEIGYAADQMVDLNRTGPLTANPEPAFEVTAAYADGRPKEDLHSDQLWRGNKQLRHYANGEWKPSEWNAPIIKERPRESVTWEEPDLGPGRFTLTYEVPGKLRSTFVATPVQWAPNQPPPLAALTDRGPRPWLAVPDGSFHWEPDIRYRAATRRYIQVSAPAAEANASPAFRFAEPTFESGLAPIRQNPVPRVRDYADDVLDALARAGDLPPDWRDPGTQKARPVYHDLVARKLSQHLMTTPTLRYTTDLRREKSNLDPVEDFLFHSKAGHCERFASALALMLRSQDIPAVFVLGFKGAEHAGGGRYVVLQEHAHAWVEALVPVPGQAARHPFLLQYHWRTLDPTPGGEPSVTADPSWWGRVNAQVGELFREYVTDYTPEQRQKALAEFATRLTQPAALAGVLAALALPFALRAALRRRAARAATPTAPPEQTRWFAELVALLAAHGITPAPGETAREYAERAAQALRERPGCAAAAVPIAWAEAYYEDRFGGTPPPAARRAELDAGLAELRRALTS